MPEPGNPFHVLTPHEAGFLVEAVMEKLTHLFPVRLTKEDYDYLHNLAKDHDIKPGQLARYAIRMLIHSNVKVAHE